LALVVKSGGTAESKTEEVRKKRKVQLAITVLAIAVPIMSYFISGLLGLLVGSIGGAIVYLLGPHVAKKSSQCRRDLGNGTSLISLGKMT
jgi:tetrahydromethanopterin S-methyltransferase subunit D